MRCGDCFDAVVVVVGGGVGAVGGGRVDIAAVLEMVEMEVCPWQCVDASFC